jgi:hypothetical protein
MRLNKRKLIPLAVILGVLAGAVVTLPAAAQTVRPACDITGDGACDGNDVIALGQAIVATAQAATAIPATSTPNATVAPATLTPAPTNAPATTTPVVATVAPQPTATMPPMAMGKCGESLTVWHPPVITAAYKTAHPEQPMLIANCATEHEHGAETPAWVVTFEQSRGRVFSYMGMHNTSPIENAANAKHVAMKGYAGVLVVPQGRVDFYAVLHGSGLPFERASILHSARFWFRFNGAVSHIQFQGNFGNPSDNERRFLRGRGQPDPDVRGLMLVADAQSAANGAGCEQWYMEPGSPPFGVDYGLTFCNLGTFYQRGEENGNVYDQNGWIKTGGTNNVRRIELAWYGDRFNKRGIFWTTVLGEMVTGPTDPRCSEVACVEQVIQTNLPIMNFQTTGGKNAFQVEYPDTGVKMPN